LQQLHGRKYGDSAPIALKSLLWSQKGGIKMSAVVSPGQILIKQRVKYVWDLVVHISNDVLRHADMYGIRAMDIPDPNVHQLHTFLKIGIIPILESLAKDPNIHPHDGVKLHCLHQCIHHISVMVNAIKNSDDNEFERAVTALEREAQVPPT
jgi:hypothetical protein